MIKITKTVKPVSPVSVAISKNMLCILVAGESVGERKTYEVRCSCANCWNLFCPMPVSGYCFKKPKASCQTLYLTSHEPPGEKASLKENILKLTSGKNTINGKLKANKYLSLITCFFLKMTIIDRKIIPPIAQARRLKVKRSISGMTISKGIIMILSMKRKGIRVTRLTANKLA